MGHISRGVVIRLLGNSKTCGFDPSKVVDHVAGCSRCWRLALWALDSLESQGARISVGSEPVRNLIALLRSQRERSLDRLGARARLGKLKRLTHFKRLDLIRTTEIYRTRAMFDVLLRDTAELARSGDVEAEEIGKCALAVIEMLSSQTTSDMLKKELRAEVWVELANGRRIRAEWTSAFQALRLAAELLQEGTGNPQPAARLHSVRSSLAFDTGQTVAAVKEAAIAQDIYRELEDWREVAASILLEANALVEIDPPRALRLTEQGIAMIDDSDIRLHVLLKGTATKSLIELGRTGEALHLLEECLGYLDQFRNETSLALRFQSYQARLLEVLGKYQEAELLYRGVMDSMLAEGYVRDSFIARLMLFNFYFLRGRLDEAAAICTEGAWALQEAGAHQQMRTVWNELKIFTETRRVDSETIKAVRLYHVEHWNTPAKQQPLGRPK